MSVTYGTRVRTQPKTVRNALLATCHLEVWDLLSHTWVTLENSKAWRPDYSFYRTMTDVLTEDFYGKIAYGQFINNPMSRDKQTVTVFPTTIVNQTATSQSIPKTTYRANVTDDSCSGVAYLLEPAGLASRINAAKVIVGTSVMAKAKSHQIQFLATLGESKETIGMITDGCKFLLNARKSIRRYGLSLLKAAKCPKRFFAKCYKDAENAWMYCRMGVRPFLGECENLHAAITHQKEQRYRTRFASKTSLRTSSSAHTGAVYANRLRGGHFKSYFEETLVSAGCVCDARVGGYPDTFGLSQVLETVWELTPLSWCVDYFLNIGKFIAAMRLDTYWVVRASWTTVKRDSEEIVKSENVTYINYGPPLIEAAGYRRMHRERITRTPGLYTGVVLLPALDTTSNRQEILDVVAVTRQKVSSLIGWVLKAENVVKQRKNSLGIS